MMDTSISLPEGQKTMADLPLELLDMILLANIRMCRCDKNTILQLRRVCKAFDAIIRPYVFKTVQLEFSRFMRDMPQPRVDSLIPLGGLVEAIYLDMMVVRDEEEIVRLSEVFQSLVQRVPEMVPLLESLKKYCMREDTFDEEDFGSLLGGVVENTPNLRRMKLNLPFQVVGQLCTTATLLLATTFSALAKRPLEHKQLEILVLDHVSDTTVNAICNNHMDLSNAIDAFKGLKSLVLSIKRQESGIARQDLFAKHLWFLIRKAEGLESLCLVGWNVKRNIMTRRNLHAFSLGDWHMRSLPYKLDDVPRLQHLRFLELRRVDIDPRALVSLITDSARSLKEIYLSEVFIKVFGSSDGNDISLWVGQPAITQSDKACWIAPELRKVEELQLDVLRATCLGYDDFEADRNSPFPDYDLKDPTGKEQSIDERFVDAVCSIGTPAPTENGTDELSTPLIDIIETVSPAPPRNQNEWDAESYQRETNNPTSAFKRCIDGYFFNHNEQALKELQNIISVADRGMTIISEEISRSRHVIVDGGTGELVSP